MTDKYNELAVLLNKYGNQLDIFDNNSFDLLELAAAYLEMDSHLFEFVFEDLDENVKIDMYRIISFLKNKITIATLEYRLFNVKPANYSIEKINELLNDLSMYDLLNDVCTTCESCSILRFNKNGKFIDHHKTMYALTSSTGVAKKSVLKAIGTKVAINNYYYRYTF